MSMNALFLKKQRVTASLCAVLRKTGQIFTVLVFLTLLLGGNPSNVKADSQANLIIVAVAPAQVTLISPEGNVGAVSDVTYSWQDVGDVTDYIIGILDPAGNPFYGQIASAGICSGSVCSVLHSVILPSLTLTDGSYTWYIQGVNASGYGPWSEGMIFTIQSDPTVPNTTITSSPPNPTTSGNASFAFTSSISGSTFQCKLDTSTFAACPNPMAYTGLPDGQHTFQVRAVSGTKVDPSPATYTWTIGTSTMPGKATLVSPTGNIGHVANVTYTWQEVAGATGYQLGLIDPENNPYYSGSMEAADVCSGSVCSVLHSVILPSLTLTDGSYTWYIQAQNASGSGEWSDPMVFTISATPTCYALTLGHTGQGSNPVASPANSTGCTAGHYVAGASISLSGAVPTTGWQISGWTGMTNNSSTAATNTVTMPASAHTAQVNYSQGVYTLTITEVGNGTVTTNVAGPYHHGDVVQLTAVADAGWYFSGWSGSLTGTTNPASITMDGNKTVTATFEENTTVVGRMGDFNGDGKAEIAVFRPSTSTWHIYGVGDFVYGTVGDIPVPADYNGDGKDDIAVFRPSNSTWYIYGVGQFVYGTVGDIPVVADYNGDGKADIAVFRPSNSTWYIYGVGQFVYGTVGDIPVIADYNGDRKADIAVFRPSTSTWYIYGVGEFVYGTVGDIPVIADYNGDQKADIAVFRPSTSTWYLYGVGQFVYGTVGDIPVIADYNGDQKADIAVFRPSTSTWYLYGVGQFLYGTVGDIPA